ncbi:MAG: hypothetical protein LIP09_07760 [Bacteroidales bacterium]|nr:hypothetical protein [Bacteroidales bacterium]
MKKDTLPTESSIKKLIMWYKVKELKSKNLKNTQISRQLGIHRMTVARYLSMSEAEFMESSSYNRYYRHKLDEYEDFVVGELRNEAGLSAAQIEDYLKALPGYDGSICSKTVYNFVQHLRKKHGLPKPEAETAMVVKNNFLKGRTYADAETLNRQALEWLARTGNGSLHHGLHRIPADLFEQERELLAPYTGHPTEPKEELRQYAVRKDNIELR